MPYLIMKFREKRYILMIRVNDHRCLIAERENAHGNIGDQYRRQRQKHRQRTVKMRILWPISEISLPLSVTVMSLF